ncbi:hypothetical protein DFH11DRAFT_1727373 [Phellopilus nigrolimitatus]|nr:hypothetical protein DFH11DRAFT_1727373 [Phellopilus nigrolimitatus]
MSSPTLLSCWSRPCGICTPGSVASTFLRLTSYYGAVEFLMNARVILEEGYRKVPRLGKWLVIVSSPELLVEVRKAPDDRLSLLEEVEETIASTYTQVTKNQYHVSIVRSQLTCNVGELFEGVADEVAPA